MRHVGDRNLAIQHSTMWSNIKRSVLGPKRLIYFFMNNIFNLNASHAQKIASLFFGRDGHTYIHTQG